jgi:hypothetical protein
MTLAHAEVFTLQSHRSEPIPRMNRVFATEIFLTEIFLTKIAH